MRYFCLFFTLILLTLLPGAAYAQSKSQIPSFEGNWLLNNGESRINGAGIDKNRRVRLQIDQVHPKIKIVVTEESNNGQAREMENKTFFFDSRGETNRQTSGEVESKTKWNNNKLVINIETNNKKKKEKEEWWLSNDGKKLFRKVVSTSEIEYQVNGRRVGSEIIKSELYFVYDRATDLSQSNQ